VLKALEGLTGVKKVAYDGDAKAIVVTREAGNPSDEAIIRAINGKGNYAAERVK
jgi:copper chaperone CopZ